MRKSGAFTRIELVVVVAVITFLLATVIPSLTPAREHAKRAVCLAHTRSLGISWALYAEENDDRIASAKTARIQRIGDSDTFSMVLSSYHNEPSWSCWVPEHLWDNKKAHEAAITLGTLYPYNETRQIYRCPLGDQDQQRTYSIVDSMNGHEDFAGVSVRAVRKRSEIESPGTRMVFIDEGRVSSESWSIFPDRIQWWDSVSVQHGDGTTVGLADNSARYWQWVDERTIRFARGEMDSIVSAQDNPDFDRIQEAVWTLKYRP
ncbi:MAG: type II secretion system protein [Phycisphaerae bacterium]|nr:type II secretion system protein [Phycisphaerae bacterium]